MPITATEMVFVGCFPDSGNVHVKRHILARTVLYQSNQIVMMVWITIMVPLCKLYNKKRSKKIELLVKENSKLGFEFLLEKWMDSFLFTLDGLIDCEDSECCTDSSCSSSQMCATVLQPRDILLKVVPAMNSNFYQVGFLSL